MARCSPILGLVMVGFAWIVGLRAVVLPLVAGFFLVGPILAVGLYDISRRLERGETVTLGHGASRPGAATPARSRSWAWS